MNHTEFKNSAIAKQANTSVREALPMIIGSLVVLVSVVVAFANAI